MRSDIYQCSSVRVNKPGDKMGKNVYEIDKNVQTSDGNLEHGVREKSKRTSRKIFDKDTWQTFPNVKKREKLSSSNMLHEDVIIHACRKCYLVCKNKRTLIKHEDECLKIKDGESFLKYNGVKKEYNMRDKIMPSSQTLEMDLPSSMKGDNVCVRENVIVTTPMKNTVNNVAKSPVMTSEKEEVSSQLFTNACATTSLAVTLHSEIASPCTSTTSIFGVNLSPTVPTLHPTSLCATTILGPENTETSSLGINSLQTDAPATSLVPTSSFRDASSTEGSELHTNATLPCEITTILRAENETKNVTPSSVFTTAKSANLSILESKTNGYADEHRCEQCLRTFGTRKGLNIHLKSCKKDQTVATGLFSLPNDINIITPSCNVNEKHSQGEFNFWRGNNIQQITSLVNSIYDEIVYWRSI